MSARPCPIDDDVDDSAYHHDWSVAPTKPRKQAATFWTDDRVKALISLWAEDIVASQIAAKLGTTKNAVIGKAYRLELPRRGEAFQRRRRLLAYMNRQRARRARKGKT
jgi:hypothetical protein